jgi:preprotein translocase subunit YajC
MQLFTLIILQAGGAEALTQFLPLILIFIVFYFFFIRPQAKKQKQQGQFIQDLKKGDEVVTGAGVIGRINKIDEHEISLQVDQKTFIRVVKGAISKEMTDAYQKPEEA